MDTSDIRKGLKMMVDGKPYAVVDFQFVKPGKGQAFTRTKLRNMMTGNVIERTFKSGEKLEKADLEERQMQYLYPEDNFYVFMDTANYEQLRLTEDQLGDNKYYLSDGLMCSVLVYNERPIGLTPPNFVEFEIIETEHLGRHHQAGQDRDRPGNPGSALHRAGREGAYRHPHRRVRRTRQEVT